MPEQVRAAFFAHTTEDGRPWEPLHEHLRLVAARAKRHAAAFDAGDEGHLAGLLHDLGKYGELFQRRLEGVGRGLDHWTLGAWAAIRAPKWQGLAAALAIEGHHIGLQVGSAAKSTVLRFEPRRAAERLAKQGQRLSEDDLDRARARLAADGLRLAPAERSLWRREMPLLRGMLAVRMLFSALVDADFVETEAFMRGNTGGRRYRCAGPVLEPTRALTTFRAKIATLGASSTAAPEVVRMRAELLADCLAAAERARGTFTLSAPTGSGKTLSMLAFALAHAARHGLRRVVFAIPFLSIIEQTAKIYHDLFAGAGFPDHYVLEHHSLSDTSGARTRDGVARDDGRLLAENWDAPLVVTTHVQLLESLFSHQPKRCRKLHNLAQSVILFDEVQTLPPELARATLAALGTLVRDFGCSVVFATATQPAFDHLHHHVRCFAAKDKTPEKERIGWQPVEIVRRAPAMFRAAKRTEVRWEIDTARPWDELADRLLAMGEQALVIVNLKRHARDLTEVLAERGAPGLRHLSTNLCPAHRSEVLTRVHQDLEARAPCLLVSTQCIEAGVDVDFPTVLRALGPLESIAQAAGRCNRHGNRSEPGQVVVFVPADEGYPPGGYQQATQVTRALLKERENSLSIDDPETFRRYYRDLYDLTGIATAGETKLEEAVSNAHFPEVAKHYRLISQDTVQVVVPWEQATFDRLRQGPFDRDWIRDARDMTVAIFRPQRGHFPALDAAPLTRRGETPSDWFLLPDPKHYHRELYGLDLAESDLWIA